MTLHFWESEHESQVMRITCKLLPSSLTALPLIVLYNNGGHCTKTRHFWIGSTQGTDIRSMQYTLFISKVWKLVGWIFQDNLKILTLPAWQNWSMSAISNFAICIRQTWRCDLHHAKTKLTPNLPFDIGVRNGKSILLQSLFSLPLLLSKESQFCWQFIPLKYGANFWRGLLLWYVV